MATPSTSRTSRTNPSTSRIVAMVAVVGAVIALVSWWRARGEQGPAEEIPASSKARAASTSSLAARDQIPSTFVDPMTAARAQIAGTVREPGGAAVADAQVCAVASSEDLADESTREPACTRTQANGRYVLAGLVPARYRVHASAAGFVPAQYQDQSASQSATKRNWLRLAPGEAREEVDITLARGGVEVRGVVKDISGGVVSGALVMISEEQRWSGATAMARSDDMGEFTAWTGPGTISVEATADGYAPGATEGVAPGQRIEVLLTPESVLAGTVVETGTKQPVADALVMAVDSGESVAGFLGASGPSARTGPDGRFRITRLAPGRYKPVARAEGRYGQAVESVRLGLGETRDDLVVEVHPAFTVEGTVMVAGTGEPCASGWLRLEERASGQVMRSQIRASGQIRVRGVLPGEYRVTVACEGKLARDRYEPVVVADQDVTGVVWDVDNGGTITGIVVAASGAPVADARVFARTEGGDPRAQRGRGWDETQADGRFALEGLAPGTYKVEVQSSEHPDRDQPVDVALAAGETKDITITLGTGGEIHGQVVDADGVSVSGAQVMARGKSWGFQGNRTRSADDGSFVLKGLSPGEYRVEALRDWWTALRAPGATDDDIPGERVSVRAGEVARVRLVVEKQAGEIRGKVVDASGQPVADAFVDAQRESDAAGAAAGSARQSMRRSWSRQPVLTEPDGTFVLRKLSPGSYTVHAYRRGGGEAVAEGVRVGASTVLTIASTGSIAGTVTVDGGGAPGQLTVVLIDSKNSYTRRESFFRTAGAWVMRDVPPGDIVVRVEAAEGTAQTNITLAEGEAKTGVVLHLAAKVTLTGRLVDLATREPVPGMRMRAVPVKDLAPMGRGGAPDDKSHISDTQGRFEIANAPAGKLYLQAMPLDWSSGRYGFFRTVVTVPAGAKRQDLGDIAVPARRVEMRERGGDLGFELAELPPGMDWDQVPLRVSLVRPDGPAAASGLAVGDIIVSVDGHDVRGPHVYRYYVLSQVQEGTTVRIGLERGAEVAITAGKPN